MSAPWMPLYVADYLADTGHLSTTEHGAYMLLIMHYWRQGGLPSDEKVLARIARMTDREWRGSRVTIAAFFSAEWKHARIEIELEKSREKSSKRAEAGARGGNAKALKTKDTTLANATILPEQKPTDALASSSQPQSDSTTTVVLARGARSKAPQKGSPLSPDWMPNSLDWEMAVEGLGAPRAQSELAKFRDYWPGVPGEKGRKINWDGTFRNWIRRALETGSRNAPKQERGEWLAYAASGQWKQDSYDDEQRSSEHQSGQSPSAAEPPRIGSDLDVFKPSGGNGGTLLDLRVLRPNWP